MNEAAEAKRERKRQKNAGLPLGSRTTAIEVYGPEGAPRIRWSCGHCAARNDALIELPVARETQRRCAFCRRVALFRFKPVEGEPDGLVRSVRTTLRTPVVAGGAVDVHEGAIENEAMFLGMGRSGNK